MRRAISDVYLNNILFLSSLAQYNSERKQLILNFCDFAVKQRTLHHRPVTLEDVQEFCVRNTMRAKDPRGLKEIMIQDNILTLLGSVSLNRNLGYVTTRYNHIDRSFLTKYGFHIGSLAMMERVLKEMIYAKSNFLDVSKRIYRFKSKEEYVNLCFLAEPDITFQSKWNACITISERELLGAYIQAWREFDVYYKIVSAIDWKVDSEEELIRLRLEEGTKILEKLSLDPELNEERKTAQIFLKPLIKTHHENNGETHYIVPFPYVLGSTIQFRLENYIQESRKISKIEEKSKGKVVEFLATQILALYPNKNVVKNFRYKIGEKIYESDVLLLLDRSIWIVEVKSHPIFKKVPFRMNKILPIFMDKIQEGLEQGERTLDFLKGKRDTLFNLGCERGFEGLIKGIIVAFDGFLPTLLTLNEKHDRLLGTNKIYKAIPEATRLYVATLLDLYFLYIQPDIGSFEEFLIWRTNHVGKFPIVSYDETEYWAFFNDRYLKDRTIRETFPQLVEKEISVSYISARFNRKDYLAKIAKSSADK